VIEETYNLPEQEFVWKGYQCSHTSHGGAQNEGQRKETEEVSNCLEKSIEFKRSRSRMLRIILNGSADIEKISTRDKNTSKLALPAKDHCHSIIQHTLSEDKSVQVDVNVQIVENSKHRHRVGGWDDGAEIEEIEKSEAAAVGNQLHNSVHDSTVDKIKVCCLFASGVVLQSITQ
jgi:hypothetical protein